MLEQKYCKVKRYITLTKKFLAQNKHINIVNNITPKTKIKILYIDNINYDDNDNEIIASYENWYIEFEIKKNGKTLAYGVYPHEAEAVLSGKEMIQKKMLDIIISKPTKPKKVTKRKSR